MFFEGVDVKGDAEGQELMVCSATRSQPTWLFLKHQGRDYEQVHQLIRLPAGKGLLNHTGFVAHEDSQLIIRFVGGLFVKDKLFPMAIIVVAHSAPFGVFQSQRHVLVS